jgi:hypothetical protein
VYLAGVRLQPRRAEVAQESLRHKLSHCHTTNTSVWATFDHKFPLNHGGGPKHKPKACSVCHQSSDDYGTYTCYGCHRHDPEKTRQKHLKKEIVEIDACARCHPAGRKQRGKKDEVR